MKNPFQFQKSSLARLSNEQIMDYLDNALSKDERAQIEAHLQTNTEDAKLVDELRFAMSAAKDWHQSEPVTVSENFWPQLRGNLGPAPSRGVLSNFQKSVRQIFGTSPTTRLSLGAATVAIVIAMGAFLFAPQSAQQPVVAEPLSTQDLAFVTQGVEEHEAFVATSPVAGDTSALETGDDEVENDENP